jgi:hypothetical protein
MQNGKGSKRRESLVSQETWDKNYERIFRKRKDGKRDESKRK